MAINIGLVHWLPSSVRLKHRGHGVQNIVVQTRNLLVSGVWATEKL